MKLSDITTPVGPELASAWLAFNTDNYRAASKQLIRQYSATMRAKVWHECIDPIAFHGSLTGKGKNKPVLANGQNRLYAIVDSETTQDFIVLEGLSFAAAESFDGGRKRSLDQILRNKGYSYPIDLAAVLRLVYAFDNDQLAGKEPSTHAVLLNYLEQHPNLAECAAFGSRTRQKCKAGWPSVFGTAYHVLSQLPDPHVEEDIDDFFSTVAELLSEEPRDDDGEPLTISAVDPRWKYARHLELQNRGKARRASQRVRLALLFKAWNAWRAGDQIQALAFKAGANNPEPFPIPE